MTLRQHVYRGQRLRIGTDVRVNDAPMPTDQDRAAGALGFDWGYTGTAPTELARAILRHHVGSDVAELIVLRFAFASVAQWDTDRWTLTTSEVETLLLAILRTWNLHCRLCADTGRRRDGRRWQVCPCGVAASV